MDQARTTDIVEGSLDNIPEPLRQRPQWVNWRNEFIDGRWTKVPYDPATGKRASTTDLMTWTTFEDAVATYDDGGYDGVGFCFCSADPFVGVDIDDCRDPETGEIEEWASTMIDKFDGAYVEASPSGKGVHIIARGQLREGRRRGRVEIYGQERFFTFTGVRV
jgi:primase-polymerase (primpol)-like protein